MKKVFLVLAAAALLMLFLPAGISESACGHESTEDQVDFAVSDITDIRTEEIAGSNKVHAGSLKGT